jgi:hypothetical protein
VPEMPAVEVGNPNRPIGEAASGEFDKFQRTEWPRQRCVEIRDFNAPPNFNAPGPAPPARRRPAQAPQTAPPGRGGLWGNAPGVGSTPTGAPALRPIFRLFRGYRTLLCHRASADGPSPPRGKRQSPRTPRTIRAMRKGSCQASGPTPGAGGLRARQFEAEGEATPQDVAGDAAALDPPRA